jgi:hypothetical protein
MIWTPPVVGKETDPKEMEEHWSTCCKLTLERFADLVFEELQKQLSNGLNNEDDLNRVQYLFIQYFFQLFVFTIIIILIFQNTLHFV